MIRHSLLPDLSFIDHFEATLSHGAGQRTTSGTVVSITAEQSALWARTPPNLGSCWTMFAEPYGLPTDESAGRSFFELWVSTGALLKKNTHSSWGTCPNAHGLPPRFILARTRPRDKRSLTVDPP